MVLLPAAGKDLCQETRALQNALCTILFMQRPNAAETKGLIELLYRPASLWQSSKKHKVGTLALISQTRDPAAIPDIVLHRGSE
jgi:hypothetical protein